MTPKRLTLHADAARFRCELLAWYWRNRRDLPWRRTSDPWRILVSEVMLQQTRVEAVTGYYDRFLKRFPDAGSLAAAKEADVLAAWSGLGYYHRARNLQRAAHVVAGGFPRTFEAIRDLPGVGEYTAAAVASIAFGLRHAAVDGNVMRVVARLTANGGDLRSGAVRKHIGTVTGLLLDHESPGDFNQALMELGATVCLPRNPRCPLCPVADLCQARRHGSEHQIPVKSAGPRLIEQPLDVLVARRRGKVLLRQRASDESRMAGFWELPALSDVPSASQPARVAEFCHTIVRTKHQVSVYAARVGKAPPGMKWLAVSKADDIPLTTITMKALHRATTAA